MGIAGNTGSVIPEVTGTGFASTTIACARTCEEMGGGAIGGVAWVVAVLVVN